MTFQDLFLPVDLDVSKHIPALQEGKPLQASRGSLLGNHLHHQWGLCQYVIVHTILGGIPVIQWISLGGKPKWLPLKFGYHDVMRTSPITHAIRIVGAV